MCQNAPNRPQPSTIAASSSSRGMPATKPRRVQIVKGSTNVMYVTISPGTKSIAPTERSIR